MGMSLDTKILVYGKVRIKTLWLTAFEVCRSSICSLGFVIICWQQEIFNHTYVTGDKILSFVKLGGVATAAGQLDSNHVMVAKMQYSW